MPWLLFYAYHTDEHLQVAGAHDTTHKHSLNCEKIYPAQAQRVHEPLTMMPACLCNTTVSMKSSWTCRRAGQHPPNLQKIYPAQAKRVRRAPDRYSVEEAPSMHRSASEEQRRLADQLHRSHPPRTHSGLSALSAIVLMPLSMRTGSVLCLLPFTSVGE